MCLEKGLQIMCVCWLHLAGTGGILFEMGLEKKQFLFTKKQRVRTLWWNSNE